MQARQGKAGVDLLNWVRRIDVVAMQAHADRLLESAAELGGSDASTARDTRAWFLEVADRINSAAQVSGSEDPLSAFVLW